MPTTLSCPGYFRIRVNLQVCAGATGAPAGFTVQWVAVGPAGESTCPGPDFVWPSAETGLCDASFSGNASGSRYNLAANQCVTVNIGDLLFDNGTSTSCPDALDCDTLYVFRAFAHGNSSVNRSPFTGNTCCATAACSGLEEGCTFTQGYWKTHGPEGCATGNNVNQWPVTSLTLGTVVYTDLQLCSILNKPASGNGLITLAHQLIAAKLNIANGADGSAIATAIANADTLIGALVVPPVGSGSLTPASVSTLVTALQDYNEGLVGPGHCDPEPEEPA
ncbi:MAG TPA: hypothetical protein VFC42_15110 [Methylomirabilota bacterium]|nr:hypothetical protein [Methylomirabilota bacterium]